MALSTSNLWNLAVNSPPLAVVGGGLAVVDRVAAVVRVVLVADAWVAALSAGGVVFAQPASAKDMTVTITVEPKRMSTEETVLTFGVSELYIGFGNTERTARMALATLKDREEWPARLAPDAPTFAANQFHTWIWGAAAQFWEAGQHATAVEYGAKSLNARVQQKSGLTLVDRESAAEVFSPKPSEKNARLWLPGDTNNDTWKSRQDGLHHLAMGAFAGIRNVVAHSLAPSWSEQEALEYLAVLSTVARWTDETHVRPPGP